MKFHVETGYYDGLSFHRIVRNFMAQGRTPGVGRSLSADRERERKSERALAFHGEMKKEKKLGLFFFLSRSRSLLGVFQKKEEK